MKTLQIIGAYAGAQEAFDRHLPFWTHTHSDILVTCPSGSPVSTTLPVLLEGKRGHHGADGLNRYLFILEWMTHFKYDVYIFHDYDSFSLDPEYPKPVAPVSGPVFLDLRPDRPFKGTQYIHPPLMITREGMEMIHERKHVIGSEIEGGFFDRWLGYLCEAAGIPVKNWYEDGICFTRNSFDSPDKLDKACIAVENGACLLHGCKTEEQLRRILAADVKRKQRLFSLPK